VVFTGNEYTPRDLVEGSLLYRCAELASQRGYDYFVVEHAQTRVRQKSCHVPGIAPSDATPTPRAIDYGALQPRGNAGAVFWYTSFEASAVIKLYRGEHTRGDRTFQVAEVLQKLAEVR
jgi:hypothetical protein